MLKHSPSFVSWHSTPEAEADMGLFFLGGVLAAHITWEDAVPLQTFRQIALASLR